MRIQKDSRTRRLPGPAPLRSRVVRAAAVVLVVGVFATTFVSGQSGVGQLLDAAWMAQASPDAIRGLLHHGADLTSRGPDGETALHHAVGNPNVGVLETLLEYGANPDVADFTGQTALDMAAGRSDRREHALALVRFGANHDGLAASVHRSLGLRSTAEALGEVPLERLLGSDWADTVTADRLRVLPAFRPDRDEAAGLHSDDLQALFRRILATNRDPAVISFLIEQGAGLEFADGVHALHVAARNANPAVVKSLLDREAPESPIGEVDARQRTALHYAAANENPAVTAVLLAAGADVNAADGNGRRALHVAALNPNPAVAALLLEEGAELSAQDAGQRSALHFAAGNASPAVAQRLLAAGADPDVEDALGQTALDRAIDQGNAGVLEVLRGEGQELSEAEVLIAVGEQPRQSIVKLLDTVPESRLDLHLRISLLNPDPAVARLLLDKGAAVAPVSMAAMNRNPAVTALLLEAGADANADAGDGSGWRALHLAAMNPNPAVAGLLLENGAEWNVRSSDGTTALHLAATNPNPAVAALLLEAGAEWNVRGENGTTALHLAATNRNPAVATLLLEAGADLNEQDEDGRTALHLAAMNPNPAVAALLLDRQANAGTRDAGQATPLTLAWLSSRSAVPAVLLRAGAETAALPDRLLDIDWLEAATAPALLAQVASALPGAFRSRDEECGRGPVHLIAHFAARNNLDARLVELDARLTTGALRRIDHRMWGFDAMLERGVSLREVDGRGNGVLHYAVAGAAKVGLATESQSFPSAGLEVLGDLRRRGVEGRAEGAGKLLPVHYAQPGAAFTTEGNALLAEVLERWFGVAGTQNPESGLDEDGFVPVTDACVVLGGSAERTSPLDLIARQEEERQ